MRHFILSRWVGNANILSEKAHRMCNIKRRPYKRMALEITGDTKCEMTLVLFLHSEKKKKLFETLVEKHMIY